MANSLANRFWIVPRFCHYSGGFSRYCLTAGTAALVGWMTHEYEVALSSIRNPWLFPSSRGPGYFANPQKLLDEVKASTNMPDFKFHDLRHYFISYCLLSGIDTLTVASWVGHSGGQLIYSTYGHVNSQHKRDAAAKLQFDAGAVTSEFAPVPDLSKMSAADLLALVQRLFSVIQTHFPTT